MHSAEKWQAQSGPQLVLLLRLSWYLGWYCLTRRLRTYCNIKLTRTSPPLLGTLFETSETPLRATNVQNHETELYWHHMAIDVYTTVGECRA